MKYKIGDKFREIRFTNEFEILICYKDLELYYGKYTYKNSMGRQKIVFKEFEEYRLESLFVKITQ